MALEKQDLKDGALIFLLSASIWQLNRVVDRMDILAGELGRLIQFIME